MSIKEKLAKLCEVNDNKELVLYGETYDRAIQELSGMVNSPLSRKIMDSALKGIPFLRDSVEEYNKCLDAIDGSYIPVTGKLALKTVHELIISAIGKVEYMLTMATSIMAISIKERPMTEEDEQSVVTLEKHLLSSLYETKDLIESVYTDLMDDRRSSYT